MTDERFWSKVQKTDKCWIWTAAKRNGYGAFRVSKPRRMMPAHHYSLSLVGREIPTGLVVDHTCRNRSCVNPDHLRFLTSVENVLCGESLSAQNSRKSFCKHGHPLSGENLAIVKRKNGKKDSRGCRQCANAITRKCYQKFREARLQYARNYRAARLEEFVGVKA